MRQCRSCGEEIDPRRLKLVPAAVSCVECIESGAANDVFTYRSAPASDEYGNFHTTIITNEKQWRAVNDDDVSAVELLKRMPGDQAVR